MQCIWAGQDIAGGLSECLGLERERPDSARGVLSVTPGCAVCRDMLVVYGRASALLSGYVYNVGVQVRGKASQAWLRHSFKL